MDFALREIGDAIQGCQLLASALEGQQFGDDREERVAPSAIVALLSLVHRHIENCGSVLAGEADHRILWTLRNDALDKTEHTDLVLTSRPPERMFKRAKEKRHASAAVKAVPRKRSTQKG